VTDARIYHETSESALYGIDAAVRAAQEQAEAAVREQLAAAQSAQGQTEVLIQINGVEVIQARESHAMVEGGVKAQATAVPLVQLVVETLDIPATQFMCVT
jgi:hypothetical protein